MEKKAGTVVVDEMVNGGGRAASAPVSMAKNGSTVSQGETVPKQGEAGKSQAPEEEQDNMDVPELRPSPHSLVLKGTSVCDVGRQQRTGSEQHDDIVIPDSEEEREADVKDVRSLGPGSASDKGTAPVRKYVELKGGGDQPLEVVSDADADDTEEAEILEKYTGSSKRRRDMQYDSEDDEAMESDNGGGSRGSLVKKNKKDSVAGLFGSKSKPPSKSANTKAASAAAKGQNVPAKVSDAPRLHALVGKRVLRFFEPDNGVEMWIGKITEVMPVSFSSGACNCAACLPGQPDSSDLSCTPVLPPVPLSWCNSSSSSTPIDPPDHFCSLLALGRRTSTVYI